MSRLQELRTKHKRNDLLFTGMGLTTVIIANKQKKEDMKTYNNFIRPIKNEFFNKILNQKVV